MSGWTPDYACAVSADGTTIVGLDTNPTGLKEGYVATVPISEPRLS